MSQLTIDEYIRGLPPPIRRFDGPGYDPDLDIDRLTGQIRRIWGCLRSGRWLTLQEIEEETGDPQASISAQLRHLRKRRFGAWEVKKRRRGGDGGALWEYRLTGNRTIFDEGENLNG